MSAEKDLKVNKEEFTRWFTGLLYDQDTCLFREILRDSKDILWENWQKHKPVWLPSEFAEAKAYARRLKVVLNKEEKIDE